jgi:hypothetical protein
MFGWPPEWARVEESWMCLPFYLGLSKNKNDLTLLIPYHSNNKNTVYISKPLVNYNFHNAHLRPYKQVYVNMPQKKFCIKGIRTHEVLKMHTHMYYLFWLLKSKLGIRNCIKRGFFLVFFGGGGVSLIICDEPRSRTLVIIKQNNLLFI